MESKKETKVLIYTLGSFFYVVLWLVNGFLVGMSHSVPYHKFNQPIYQYLFLIMMAELVLYLFLSHVFQKLKGSIGQGISFFIAIVLCVTFPWQIIQFTQYGHGYKWVWLRNLPEPLMVLSVNLLPLVLIMVTTAYRERLGKALFGWFTGISTTVQ